jgi:DNA-binding transcriptional MerR regulator
MRTVVKLTHVEAHRIRFWETRYGLIRPARDESGRRLYTGEDIDRIRQIGEMLDQHGLSLLAIRRLLRVQTA